METRNPKRSLRTLVATTLLSGVAVAVAPAVAEAQIVICWIYSDSTTDDYSDFCYGNGSGCAECIIIEYMTGGGGDGPPDLLPEGAAAASGALRLGDRDASQPVGLVSGTGLPRLRRNEAACKEPRLDSLVRIAGSEHLSSARKDRLRTRRVRDVAR